MRFRNPILGVIYYPRRQSQLPSHTPLGEYHCPQKIHMCRLTITWIDLKNFRPRVIHNSICAFYASTNVTVYFVYFLAQMSSYYEILTQKGNVHTVTIASVGNENTKYPSHFKCYFNTLRPGQNGRCFADDISKCISLNENVWIAIRFSLKFIPRASINNIPALVQMMAWRRSGDKPSSESKMA